MKIAANVAWLERAQIKPGDRVPWPGSWTYNEFKTQPGDNSNTQYALLGLNAATEVGVPVNPEVWKPCRATTGSATRKMRGAGAIPPTAAPATGSMSCAGISSLVITGLKRFQGQEFLVGDKIENCGKGGFNISLQRATDWLARNFHVGQNFGNGQQWKFYYLYGLERAGRLTGQRFFGEHDWYREGAEELVARARSTSTVGGAARPWRAIVWSPRASRCSFSPRAVSPVLINKLRHRPKGDWNNDTDDIRNLTGLVSRDWKNLVTWQVVDPNIASVQDLLQAPIVFFNGHEAPEFSAEGEKALRDYVDQGGFIFAEACCGKPEFDRGFRRLMEKLFPESTSSIYFARITRSGGSRFPLNPDIHPLLGITHGCRTVVIYSPEDLSCYWNQSETNPANPAVIKALRVGQNVVDYATGQEMPADKLAVREVHDFAPELPKRGALQIAKTSPRGRLEHRPLGAART